MGIYYGLTDLSQLVEMSHRVCEVLGHGSNNAAVDLLLETACAETLMGTLRDRTDYRAGGGVTQIDPIGLRDVQKRTPGRIMQLVRNEFDINLSAVEHRELEHSPLLSLIVCRLHYRLKPEQIPADRLGRAAYWKRHYNTSAGKGSPEEYLDRWASHGAPEMERWA